MLRNPWNQFKIMWPHHLPLIFLSSDCHRFCLLMSIEEVSTCWHRNGEQGLDVCFWPCDLGPQCLVRSHFLLWALLPWCRAALSFSFSLCGQLHPVTVGEAAVQSNAVLLGCLRSHWRPFLQEPTDNFLPGAASAYLAALFWHQWLSGHEPHCAFPYTSRDQKPYMWFLGPAGHLLDQAGHAVLLLKLDSKERLFSCIVLFLKVGYVDVCSSFALETWSFASYSSTPALLSFVCCKYPCICLYARFLF